ncbi:MAG: hypothetical protein ACHQRM_17690, partial [Bacteroidia bacterium]
MHKTLHPCVWIFSLILLLNSVYSYAGGGTKTHAERPGWVAEHPFEHRVVIENKGQFDGKNPSESEPILFGARTGSVDLYFSKKGLCFRRDYYKQLDEEGREIIEHRPGSRRAQQLTKPDIQLLQAEWVGSNPLTTITAEEAVTTSFNYPGKGPAQTIFAKAFKKITYHDLYPNVDVEYTLPDGKQGLKYNLIVHPGADLSKVHLRYSGDMKLNASGDLLVDAAFGPLCDHAPAAWYQADHKNVSIRFKLIGNELSFDLPHGYDPTLALVIDPWT